MSKRNYNLASLGFKIRHLRERRGYTREVLSEMTNVSSRMVYNWEGGLSIPTIKRLVKIAQLFDVSIDYLLSKDANN